MSPIHQKSNRNHVIKIRVTPDELAAIRVRAGDAATAEWLRNIALDVPIATTQRSLRCHARPLPEPDPDRAWLTREISRIGTNMNQLARAVNHYRSVHAPINMLMVATQLAGIWKELESVQQSFQTRQGKSDRSRLSTVSQGCTEENPESTGTIDAGRSKSDQKDHP